MLEIGDNNRHLKCFQKECGNNGGGVGHTEPADHCEDLGSDFYHFKVLSRGV